MKLMHEEEWMLHRQKERKADVRGRKIKMEGEKQEKNEHRYTGGNKSHPERRNWRVNDKSESDGGI